jgi:cysteine desulfurase
MKKITHGEAVMPIYADHAATHPIRVCALEAMTAALRLWGNPSSLHAAGRDAREALEEARRTVARLLGARPSEIIFTSGGSESNTAAIRSAAAAGARVGKMHLITSAVEHPSVLRTMEALAEEGFSVEYLPVTPEGYVTPDRVAAAIRPDTALVAIMHANNEIGTVQPIRDIAALCLERGIHIHTDGVQTVGRIPVAVQELGVDTLALSGHKFGAPRGIGALYIKKGVPFTPLIPGGHQEGNRRAGTENLPGAMGMAAALTEAVGRMEEENQRLAELSNQLAGEITGQVSDVRVNGCLLCGLPGGMPCGLPHVVSMTFGGVDGEALVYRLDAEGIQVSAGSACTAGSADPSHVITALGIPPEEALGTIRVSLGESNTREDIARITEALVRIVGDLRGAPLGH